MISFSREQNILGQFALAGLILGNIFIFQLKALAIILALLFIWLNSRKLADIFAADIHQGFKNLVGFLIIIAYISLTYTLAYHVYQIDFWVFLFTFLSIPIIVEVFSYFKNSRHYFLANLKLSPPSLQHLRRNLLPILVIVFDIILLVGLQKSTSIGIIRSPWELLGQKFWTVFTLSNFFLLLSIIDQSSRKNILLISFHFFVLASIGIILYPLGFGYDSFIHAAVIKVIDQTGTIEPRLFLYIGQYGLTFFFGQIFQIDPLVVNKWLLPIIFAIIWPASVFYGLRYGFKWPFSISYLASCWSLVIGFNFAVMTTPQNLAYVFVAMMVFLLPIIIKKSLPLFFPWLISAMTMAVHPLGGVPLFFLSAYISILRIKKFPKLRKMLLGLNFFGALLGLPLLFAIYQRLNHISWPEIITPQIGSFFRLPDFYWHNTFSFPLDMFHNLANNFFWLYSILFLLGLYFIYQNSKYIFFQRLFYLLLVIFVNYVLAALFLSFNLQINYQKDAYLERLLYLLLIATLPVFLTTFYFLWQHTLKTKKAFFGKTLLLLLSLLLVSVSTYFSYPIYDRLGNSKSFNVSASDLKTVILIDQHSQGEPYIVLANQMVGAAAIDSFGFAHYYNDNFYYSMPLGSDNIYQNYLAMIEQEASRQEAISAMDKTQVDRLYFVVNNYWHSAKQAIAQASVSADQKILVDQGVNTIFVYQR
ncbi:MAG: hypothetical protein PHO91_02170 [Patescibacteria group bacterium]|nr:hypothetical protein [Patescibacteria group bacterium]